MFKLYFFKIYFFSLFRKKNYQISNFLIDEFFYLNKNLISKISKLLAFSSTASIFLNIILCYFYDFKIQVIILAYYIFICSYTLFKYPYKKFFSLFFLKWLFEKHYLHMFVIYVIFSILSINKTLGIPFSILIFLFLLTLKSSLNLIKILITIFLGSLVFIIPNVDKFIFLSGLAILLFYYLMFNSISNISAFYKTKYYLIDLQKIFPLKFFATVICTQILINTFIHLFFKNPSETYLLSFLTTILLIFLRVKGIQQSKPYILSVFFSTYSLLNTNYFSLLLQKLFFTLLYVFPIFCSNYIFITISYHFSLNDLFIFFIFLGITALFLFDTFGNYNQIKEFRVSVPNLKELDSTDLKKITFADAILIFLLFTFCQVLVTIHFNKLPFSISNTIMSVKFISALFSIYFIAAVLNISIQYIEYKNLLKKLVAMRSEKLNI